MNSLVSIILPTYNRATLIAETIESVIQQTYSNWELIIVDDGSDDDTETIVKHFNDSRITFHKIPHCGLLGKVRNYGINIAKGDYIAFIDSDDLWSHEKLEKQFALLNDPEIFFTFSNGSHFGPSVMSQPSEMQSATGNLFKSLLNECFVIYMPSFMFKKTVLSATSSFDENLKTCVDVEFAYRLAYRFKGSFSNERLVSIRKNDGLSSQHEDIVHQEYISIINQLFQEGLLEKNLCIRVMAKSYYKIGLNALNKSDSDLAIQHFKKYVSLRPTHYKGWIRLGQSLIKKLRTI